MGFLPFHGCIEFGSYLVRHSLRSQNTSKKLAPQIRPSKLVVTWNRLHVRSYLTLPNAVQGYPGVVAMHALPNLDDWVATSVGCVFCLRAFFVALIGGSPQNKTQPVGLPMDDSYIVAWDQPSFRGPHPLDWGPLYLHFPP